MFFHKKIVHFSSQHKILCFEHIFPYASQAQKTFWKKSQKSVRQGSFQSPAEQILRIRTAGPANASLNDETVRNHPERDLGCTADAASNGSWLPASSSS